MFKKNEGTADRLIRAISAIVLFGLAYFVLEGFLAVITFILAVALFATAVIGFCGLYSLLGINTCQLRTQNNEEGRAGEAKNQKLQF